VLELTLFFPTGQQINLTSRIVKIRHYLYTKLVQHKIYTRKAQETIQIISLHIKKPQMSFFVTNLKSL